MELTITLAEHLATELTHRASAEQRSPEEFAERLLENALEKTAGDGWQQKNRRRLELIRKSMTGQLDKGELSELELLQAELDRRLENSDDEILTHQRRVKQAAEQIANDAAES